MKCPKCIAPMIKVTFAGTEVYRCTECQGLFFDEFDKAQLKRMKGADALDPGDAKVGRELNRVERIDCPRCSSRMMRMVELHQPHIWFEHCTVCNGSFFDAGEFKDLRHHTIADFFRDLMVKERRGS